MSHIRSKLKSVKLIQSDVKIGSVLNNLYEFVTPNNTFYGYVSGVADNIVLRNGFEGFISFWIYLYKIKIP